MALLISRLIKVGAIGLWLAVLLSVSCQKSEVETPEAGIEPLATEQIAEISEPTAKDIIVNGKVISSAELEQEVDMLAARMQGRMPPQQLEAMKPRLRKQAEDNVITRALLLQAAAKENIQVDEKEVSKQVAEIERSFPSKEAFNSRMAQMGVSADKFRKDIRQSLVINKLFDRQMDNLTSPTEPEIETFYKDNKKRFYRPDRVRASHILIGVDKDDTPEAKAQKRQGAERVLGELHEGADFAELAKRHSACDSAANGGDLGYFGRGQMVKPFEDAAFKLKPGELSDIVETRFGYHIIKVTDHQEASTTTLAQARPQINNFLWNQKRRQTVQNYIDSLKSKAVIEYKEKK